MKIRYRDKGHPNPQCREWFELDTNGCSMTVVDAELKAYKLEDDGWEVEILYPD